MNITELLPLKVYTVSIHLNGNWNFSIKFNTVYWVISVGVNSVVFSKSKRKYSVVIICANLKYHISSGIRQRFSLPKQPQNLDPSYKMDLDL